VIRFGAGTTPANLSDATVVTRTPKGRIASATSPSCKATTPGKFNWDGRQHDLIAGVDFYQEDARRNNNFAGPASGLNTTVARPTMATRDRTPAVHRRSTPSKLATSACTRRTRWP